jgi:hypothetical protein
VDENAASNYTVFDHVRVFDRSSGTAIPYSGGTVWLPEVYLPNYTVKKILICTLSPTGNCGPHIPPIPDMTLADTAGLTWNPDYVLTNAPNARRTFGQFQLTVDVARPTWGSSFSFVVTSLKGNLDNVSGYVDPETYEAGPYVHPNEGVNAYGYLPNYAAIEGKLSIWGNLPWNMRGGAFWTYRSGDHYAPRFRLTALGIWTYRADSQALLSSGKPLFHGLFEPLEGASLFVGPRGLPELEARSNLDLHLERLFDIRGQSLSLALDLFNVLGAKSVTQLNTMVNNGVDYYPNLTSNSVLPWDRIPSDQYFQAVWERVQPRILRFSLTAYF